jgi:hypothetical protein
MSISVTNNSALLFLGGGGSSLFQFKKTIHYVKNSMYPYTLSIL